MHFLDCVWTVKVCVLHTYKGEEYIYDEIKEVNHHGEIAIKYSFIDLNKIRFETVNQRAMDTSFFVDKHVSISRVDAMPQAHNEPCMEAPDQTICEYVIIISLRYTEKRNEVVAKKEIEKDDTNLAKDKRVCKQKKCFQKKITLLNLLL